MRRLFIFFAVAIVLLAPSVILAQTKTVLVPCDGPDCDACKLVELGNNIVRWLVSVFAVLAAIVFVIAGLKMASAGGNTGKVSEAKSMMTNTVIGLIILLASWMVVNTLMTVFLTGGAQGTGVPTLPIIGLPWNQIECTSQPVSAPPTTGTTPPTTPPTALCNDDAALMAQYKGSPVGAEDPGLRPMINCYLADAGIAAAYDPSQLFTVDQTYPRCSLTNGNRVCGTCSHSANSCHYGRGSGTGARAVDFNARSGVSENDLFIKIRARQAVCGGSVLFESNHTHISMAGC